MISIYPPNESVSQINIASFDTGTLNTTTSAIDISRYRHLIFVITQATGTISGSIVTLQVSVDGSTWFDSTVSVSGSGISSTMAVASKYVRFKVTTISTLPSTATILVQLK